MSIKIVRIYIKYLRKFLAGFVSVIPFVKVNSSSYPFAKENHALSKDWVAIGEDLNLAIKKHDHERKKQEQL